MAFCALKTGRPVFQQYSREEEFISCSTRKPMRVTVKLGAKKDGKNRIRMDQLKLGEKVESEQAIDAPLELALTIMTDAQFNWCVNTMVAYVAQMAQDLEAGAPPPSFSWPHLPPPAGSES